VAGRACVIRGSAPVGEPAEPTGVLNSKMNMISRENNFNLLRLFAALQVMFLHIVEHLKIDIGIFKIILSQFPGVPIFFTISGFLITMSFCGNNDIKKYFRNRFLRIYPALWLCALITSITMLIFANIPIKEFFSIKILLWFLGHITVFQYYTPDMLRSWGVGAPNGSLWTIPVEIEFYIAIPLIFLLFKKIPLLIKLVILFIVSYMVNVVIGPFYHSQNEAIAIKLAEVSIFPHLFNFLIGSLLFYFWNTIKNYIEGKALAWLLVYCLYVVTFEIVLKLYAPSYYPNIFGLIHTVLLSIMIIAAAFTCGNFTNTILKDIDISYGIYIFHMPVINMFVNFRKYELISVSTPPLL
jgi:peptidoglycan/LPS O-acetylase OafA/YrhL